MTIKEDTVLIVDTLAELILRNDEKDRKLAYLAGSAADDDGLQGYYRFDADSVVTADSDKTVQTNDDAGVAITRGRWIRLGGSAALPVVTQPVSGSITMEHRPGPSGRHVTKFTLVAAQIPVTDAGGSGSFGALELAAIPLGAFATHGSRQDYTAFAEGSALTGGAGDAVFDIGVGSVAIASAADGALAGTDDDICGEIAVTLSGGTGVGTNVGVLNLAFNGTASAGSFNLNWSGTAATIDANSTIDVTGTITIEWTFLDDD